jgi:hypothetical protein
MADMPSFRESNLLGRRFAISGSRSRTRGSLRDRGFRAELAKLGIAKVTPSFCLSTEWGVPFGTVAIAIPFPRG